MSLSRRDRVVLDTLLPAGADPVLPRGVLDVGFDPFYEEFSASASPFIRRAFGLACAAATWLAPVLIGSAPPLERLSRDDRERALEAMASSRVALLRQLVVLLKLVSALAYGADASVREALGYTRRAT